VNLQYQIVLSGAARNDLKAIRNRATLEQINERIQSLASEPHRGKPLRGRLSGFRSIRAARNHYRVIYRLEEQVITIYVVAIGLREEDNYDGVHQRLERIAGKLRGLH